jgi:hypothetical protein
MRDICRDRDEKSGVSCAMAPVAAPVAAQVSHAVSPTDLQADFI